MIPFVPAGITKVVRGGETAVELSIEQSQNIKRFIKKIPSNAKNNVEIKPLPNGGVSVQATSPAQNIPKSKAVYEKQIDANGNTINYSKTTYGPDGEIIHVKYK